MLCVNRDIYAVNLNSCFVIIDDYVLFAYDVLLMDTFSYSHCKANHAHCS